MHVRILLQITGDDGTFGPADEIAAIEKTAERPEDLGLSLAEGKTLIAAIQRRTVVAQVAAWSKRRRCCETCGDRRRSKGSYLSHSEPFTASKVRQPTAASLPVPRSGRAIDRLAAARTTPSHIAPERLYLEARWASLVPYAAAAGLLVDVLPITSGTNATTLREHVLHVAEHAEAELGEERRCIIDGCRRNGRSCRSGTTVVVGLDGGYVRNWEDRKTNFEVIVGRSLPKIATPATSGWCTATIPSQNAGNSTS